MGSKRKDILYQFLAEAGLLTFLGGVLGVILAVAITFLVYIIANSYGLNWPYYVPPSALIGSILFSVAVGLFFGVYPARKAADIDPIEALRRE